MVQRTSDGVMEVPSRTIQITFMTKRILFLSALTFSLYLSVGHAEDAVKKKPHILFLAGDEEYRSEQSLPMLKKLVERELGFETSIGFSRDADGNISPTANDSTEGMEKLPEADLLVMFYRFRNPSPENFQLFLDYVEAGKPIVGFRTSTHAFRFPVDSPYTKWGGNVPNGKKNSFGGGEAIRDLLGQKWISHHGHFDDGKNPLTALTLIESQKSHPVLRGVYPFPAYSWLYHVEGPNHSLAEGSTPLMLGTSLQSNHEKRGNTETYPLTNPVAWTKNYGDKNGRVFFTTLGHPYDFRSVSMRKMALNGMLWALGKENDIPESGVTATLERPFNPGNSGFGKPKAH